MGKNDQPSCGHSLPWIDSNPLSLCASARLIRCNTNISRLHVARPKTCVGSSSYLLTS